MRTEQTWRRHAAVSEHRAGRLVAARAAYEALLADSPEDPDLLGLMGALALQQGRPAEAEAWLDRADAAGEVDPRLRLRNLNTRLVLLGEQDREAEARALVSGDLPGWPAEAQPDARERETLLSLAEALLRLGRPGEAAGLLRVAAPRPDEPRTLSLAGQVRLALEAPAEAVELLEAADRLRPDDFATLAALALARRALGEAHQEQAVMGRLVRLHPYHVAPRREGHRLTVLTLNTTRRGFDEMPRSARALHLHENFPSQVADRLAGRYRFLSLLADRPVSDLPWQADGPDVVLSNLVNAEQMNQPGRREAACALVDRIGRPVINHPNAVFASTRQKVAALLADIPGLRLPRIERYRRGRGTPDEIAADIEQRFAYPVILRHVQAHSSSDALLPDRLKPAILARSRAELDAVLADCGWSEFYALEFVDLRRPEGWWRKIRAFCVGDSVQVATAGCFGEWMVSGWWTRQVGIDFYRANPAAVAHYRAIVSDPEACLGPEALRVLEEIRARVPLDCFGFDFDVDATGQVVFFEASAAMIFWPVGRIPEDIAYPIEPTDRVVAELERLIERRAAEVA